MTELIFILPAKIKYSKIKTFDHTCSSLSKLRRWYLCQVIKAGPLWEKSMALNGRPGPARELKFEFLGSQVKMYPTKTPQKKNETKYK